MKLYELCIEDEWDENIYVTNKKTIDDVMKQAENHDPLITFEDDLGNKAWYRAETIKNISYWEYFI